MNENGEMAVHRRLLLKAGGAVVMSAWLLGGCGSSGVPQTGAQDPVLRGPDRPTPRARFLDEAERRTLLALVDRLVPGDSGPGAAAAGADEAIDALLAAFLTDPPLIWAGGPFSDRAGGARNDFVRFIPLDEYETLAWRLAIEGSQGLPEREFNGPVRGLQQVYREGLAHLDVRAAALGAAAFADLPAAARDLIVNDLSDAEVQALVDVAFLNTLDGTYGAPEYGGNRDGIAWAAMNWPGDVQPRGYTDAEVVHREPPGLFDALLPPSYGGPTSERRRLAARSLPALPSLPLPPLLLVAGESLVANIQAADGSLAALRQRLQPPAGLRPEWQWRAPRA